MPRYQQGTTDHDGDGKMGGSLKETDMTKKTPAKKAESIDTQSGQDTTALTPKEQRAELNKKFEEADEKGRAEMLEEMQVGQQVRGY